ncbi:MAG TPA: glycerophosphodiester phosphodiesterase [Burkholderiales bacterium]
MAKRKPTRKTPRARPAAETRPIVIAHRGASGYLPEHTLAGYAVAMLQGADFIEPDLVMTKDGHLIARHDNVLDLTTDVAQRPEFAERRTEKSVDGTRTRGWFSEDFALAEIKQLRAVERIPNLRPANARLNGQFEVPTLQEIIDLVKANEKALGRKIGIYPETKHPTYFQRLGLAMEGKLVKILHANGYATKRDRVFIQSFEIGNLKKLRRLTRMPLIQLLETSGAPADVVAANGSLTYNDMATAEGLREIASYADGVGPEKYHFIVRRDADGALDAANGTDFVRNAHACGLNVHPYTFRAENHFLPTNLRAGTDPNARGDLVKEIEIFLCAGIDGFFTDQSDIGVSARDGFLARR